MLLATKKTDASSKASEKDAPKLTRGQSRAAKSKGTLPKIMCVHHGKELSEDNFYKSNKGSLFKGLDKMPVCKDCVKKIYMDYYHSNGKDVVTATFLTCRKLDMKFDLTTCQAALERANGNGEDVMSWYMQMYNSLNQLTAPTSFDHSDSVNTEGSIEDMVNKIQGATKLDSTDKRNMRDIKKKLGYDPFENSGMNDYQLARCYQELVSFLEDDDLAFDAYRLNIVLQIINTNMQIRQIDLFISLLATNVKNFEDNMAMLVSLNNTKSKLVDSATKIYRENKWLTTDATGKSKLSVLMKKYRDYGFTEAEVNYFDMTTSESARTIMDLSHKSIVDIVNFGEMEQRKIFEYQRELIDSKDKEIEKLAKEKFEIANELVDAKKKLAGE
jgi:hypothetical protein